MTRSLILLSLVIIVLVLVTDAKKKPKDIFKKYTLKKKGGVCWWDIKRKDCAICRKNTKTSAVWIPYAQLLLQGAGKGMSDGPWQHTHPFYTRIPLLLEQERPFLCLVSSWEISVWGQQEIWTKFQVGQCLYARSSQDL